jgi:hypothetical protein
MARNCERIGRLVLRVQRDFLDIPDLALTSKDAQRRFHLDQSTCDALLSVLVDARVLARTQTGHLVRRFATAESRSMNERGPRTRAIGHRAA